jgi:serine/threonine protein phosphatase PrpC
MSEAHLRGERLDVELVSPIHLELGRSRLTVVNPHQHLTPEDQARFNSNLDAIVLGSDFDPSRHVGYKGLRESIPVIIGRSDPGRFTELDSSVSRRHVALTLYSGIIAIRDLGSVNGTRVSWTPRSEAGNERAAIRREYAEAVGLSAAGFSVASELHANYNDDAWFADVRHGSFGVFDGVGGAPGSALASKIAAEGVQKQLARIHSMTLPVGIAAMHVTEALEEANRSILLTGNHIQTTATVAKIFVDEKDGRKKAAIGSVGDSRAYLWRSGQLSTVTLDHGINVDDSDTARRRMQDTFSNVVNLNELTLEERNIFHLRNLISSALGSDERFQIASSIVELKSEDRLLLTSDGIHDNLITTEIERRLNEDPSDSSASKALVHSAQRRSRNTNHMRAKPDDMTAVVVTVG